MNVANQQYSADFIDKLRKVVPGDVWVKDSTLEGTNTTRNDHIAIIAFVPSNAMELSIGELMNKIILVEGEYTNKIQSVIKRLSVGMYNSNTIPGETVIYSNFSIPKNEPVGLNCQSWAIRRLK